MCPSTCWTSLGPCPPEVALAMAEGARKALGDIALPPPSCRAGQGRLGQRGGHHVCSIIATPDGTHVRPLKLRNRPVRPAAYPDSPITPSIWPGGISPACPMRTERSDRKQDNNGLSKKVCQFFDN